MTPEEQQALVNQQLASQLLPPQQAAPSSALIAPPEYQPVYGEKDKLDPRRMFWAGMLSDIGNSLMMGGQTGRMGPMRGMGLQQMLAARNYNTGLDRANAAAQRQYRQDQNTYANQLYGRERHNVADTQWQAQQDALAAQREQQQANADRQFGLQQEQVNQGWAKMQADAQRAAATSGLDQVKATNSLTKDYNSLQKPVVEGLKAGDKVLALLDNPNPVSDYASLYAFANVLDPGAIVTDGDRDSIQQVDSLKNQLVSQIDALKNGKGIGTDLRNNIRKTVETLNALQLGSYQVRENQYQQMLAGSGLNPDIVLGGTGYSDRAPVGTVDARTNAQQINAVPLPEATGVVDNALNAMGFGSAPDAAKPPISSFDFLRP